MEFSWNTEQIDFRATVRKFLQKHLRENWESIAHGPGSASQNEFSKQFCAQLAYAGLLVLHWPEQRGGRNADAWPSFILAEEM